MQINLMALLQLWRWRTCATGSVCLRCQIYPCVVLAKCSFTDGSDAQLPRKNVLLVIDKRHFQVSLYLEFMRLLESSKSVMLAFVFTRTRSPASPLRLAGNQSHLDKSREDLPKPATLWDDVVKWPKAFAPTSEGSNSRRNMRKKQEC